MNKKLSSYKSSNISQYNPKPISNKTNSFDDSKNILNQLEYIKEQNLQLLQSAQEQGISEKDIEKVNDNRNFFQKLLNLKENQGLITGTLELMNRPAEALQGMLAESMSGGDIMKGLWEGLYGIKDFTLEDTFGIKINDPLANGIANLLFEVGVDPFNFMNQPVKTILTKSKNIANKVLDKFKVLATRSETSQSIYDGLVDVFTKVSDEFKKTFGVWKDEQYLDVANNMSNITHNIKEGTQSNQKLLIELYKGTNNLVDDFIKNFDTYSKKEIHDIFKMLDLDKDFTKQLFNTDNVVKSQARDTLQVAFNRTLQKSIESNMTHGKNIADILQDFLYYTKGEREFIELVDTEGFYKTAEALKDSEVYKRLNKILDGLSPVKLGDYFKIERMETYKKGLGGTFKDGLDESIRQTPKQGWVLKLRDDVAQDNKIVNKLNENISKSLKARNEYIAKRLSLKDTPNAKTSVLDEMINKFNTTGMVDVDITNDLMMESLNKYLDLYKTIVGDDLKIIETKLQGNKYRFQLAPNKQSYDYMKSLQSQIKKVESQRDKVTLKLFEYNKLVNEQNSLIETMNDCKSYLLAGLLEHPETILPKTKQEAQIWAKEIRDKIFEPYESIFNMLKKKNKQLISPVSRPNRNNFTQLKPAIRDLVEILQGKKSFISGDELVNNEIIEETARTIKFIDIDKVRTDGTTISLPFVFDFTKETFKNVSQAERLHIVAYMIHKRIIRIQDLLDEGVDSLQKLVKLNNETFTKILGRSNGTLSFDLCSFPKPDSFFVYNDWVNDLDNIPNVNDMLDLMGNFFEAMGSGLLTPNDVYDNLIKQLSDETIIQHIMNNKTKVREYFNNKGQYITDALEKAQAEFKKVSRSINSYQQKNNIPQLKVLEEVYTKGVYNPIEQTRVGRLMKSNDAHNIANLNEKLDDLIVECRDRLNSLSRETEFFKHKADDIVNILKNQYGDIIEKVNWNLDRVLSLRDVGWLSKAEFAYVEELGGGSIRFVKNENDVVDNAVRINKDMINKILEHDKYKRLAQDFNNERADILYTMEEATIALELNRNDFTYSVEGLKNLIQEESKRLAQEVNTNMLARLSPNFKNKRFDEVFKDTENKYQLRQSLASQIDKSMKDIDKDIERTTKQAATQIKEDIKQKKQQVKSLEKEINKMEKQNAMEFVDVDSNDYKRLTQLKDMDNEIKILNKEVEIAQKKLDSYKIKHNITKDTIVNNPKLTELENILTNKTHQLAQAHLNKIKKVNRSDPLFKRAEKAKRSAIKAKQKELDTLREQIDNPPLPEDSEIVKHYLKMKDDLQHTMDVNNGELTNLKSYLDDLSMEHPNIPFKEYDVGNITDDIISNTYNDAYVFNTPLLEADKVYVDDFIQSMNDGLGLVNELLSLEKIDFNSNKVFNELLMKVPQQLQDNINRLANVQMSIHGQISRMYKSIYGVDMFNWDVQGYMRHMLNVDAAQLTTAIKAVEGKLGIQEGSSLFGRNMKKYAMHREYQGNVVDVNKAFGSELFNDNPIETTALALELLPQSFSLGGVFKNMVNCGVIKKLPWVGDELNKVSLEKTKQYLQDEIDLIMKDKKLNDFQKKNISEYESVIKEIESIESIMDEQKGLGKFHKEEKEIYDTNIGKSKELKKELKSKLYELELTKIYGSDKEFIDLKKDIEKIKDELKSLDVDPDSIKLSDEVAERLQNLQSLINDKLNKVQPTITKIFKNTNAYANSYISKHLSNEYKLLDKTMIQTIKNSFEGFSKASLDITDLNLEKKLKGNEWVFQMDDIVKSLDEGETYVIHKGVYEYIKRYSFSKTNTDAGALFKLMQKYITVPFKKFSLLSVGFHVRNLLTNFTNAYLIGINPIDLHRGMTEAAKELKLFEKFLEDLDTQLITGKYRTAESQINLIRKMIKENPNGAIFKDYLEMNAKGIIGNNQFNSDMVELIHKIKNSASGIQGSLHIQFKKPWIQKPQAWINGIIKKSFEVSKHMDDYAKISMYRLAKSNPKYQKLVNDLGFTGANAPEKFVKFALFDYNNLTFREETYMKALFPFYTWMRKNFEFQLKNFVKNDKKYLKMFNALQGWRNGIVGDEDNETDIYENYIPIWNEDGKITYIKFNPSYDDVDRLLDGSALVNGLTPLIKTPLEMITGYDFFTRRNFNTNGVVPGFGLGFNNMLGTFNVVLKTLFSDYQPTYEDKKLAGIIGKKLIDLTEASKNVLTFASDMQDNSKLSQIFGLFPSVFSENDIAMSQYFNAKEKQQQIQDAIKYYKK